MDAIRMRGTRKLEGRIQVSAAKNVALPSSCATSLPDGESAIEKKLAVVGADIERINLADEDR